MWLETVTDNLVGILIVLLCVLGLCGLLTTTTFLISIRKNTKVIRKLFNTIQSQSKSITALSAEILAVKAQDPMTGRAILQHSTKNNKPPEQPPHPRKNRRGLATEPPQEEAPVPPDKRGVRRGDGTGGVIITQGAMASSTVIKE